MARTSFALIESFLIDPLGWVMISILLRDLYKYLCLFHFSMCDVMSKVLLINLILFFEYKVIERVF